MLRAPAIHVRTWTHDRIDHLVSRAIVRLTKWSVRSVHVNAIELVGLHKRYGGRTGIDDVSLSVPAGALFGFIGPNGAGKTTTIRIVLGLLRPTRGTARVFGRSSDDPGARDGVGYVAGETHLIPRMRVHALLAYLGGFHAGDHEPRRRELARALDLDLDAPTEDLSLGNAKKVALVAALQHAPRLLVLDEPTSGLDPVIRARLFGLLRDEVARGTTVFLSSHVLADVEALCQTVAIIANGRIVVVDDVAALRARTSRRIAAMFDGGGDPAVLTRLVQRLDGVSDLERHGTAIRFLYRGPMPPLLDALAAASPSDARIETPSLDDVFLEDFAPPGDRHAA
jgi:ABC-2 type transport system ATP-binding protein